MQPTEEQLEQAWKAVKVANGFKPQWQSLLRMFARDPRLKLQFSATMSATDGNTVWLKLPMDLGKQVEHDKLLCNKRNDHFKLICTGCATLEEIVVNLIHEAAHVLFKTFEKEDPGSLLATMEAAILQECQSDPDDRRANYIRREMDKLKALGADNLYQISSAISPFFPQVMNAVEDVRVNTAMTAARAGIMKMFEASHYDTFHHGVKQSSGERKLWRDYPPNMQAIIAVFLEGSGMDSVGTLHEDVTDILLGDYEFPVLVKEIANVTSVRESFGLGFKLLDCLRRLGFLQHENDMTEPPPPPPQPESKDEESSEDQEQDEDEGEGEEGEQSSQDAEQDDDGNGQGDESDESEGESDQDGSGSESDEDSEQDDDGEATDGAGEPSQDPSTPSHDEPSEPETGDPDHGATADDSDAPSDDKDSADPGESEGSAQNPSAEGDDPSTEQEVNSVPPEDGEPGSSWISQWTDYGTPEEVEKALKEIGGHAEEEKSNFDKQQEATVEEATETALQQSEHFDKPSGDVPGLKVVTFEEGRHPWTRECPLQNATPTVLAPALNHLRVVFTDNKRGAKQRHLLKGRVDPKVLGKRVPVEDYRIFQHKSQPGVKDYFVTIGVDLSGSTGGGFRGGMNAYGDRTASKLYAMKAAAGAKAEMLQRLGIKFAFYGHSADDGIEMCEVKSPKEPWSDVTRDRLASVSCYGYNLDGHSLEFYRKVTERQQATNRVILYYTDGLINNIGEEWDIFSENVEICRRHNITVCGVEVGTDSGLTETLGLPTVRIDGLQDVNKVVTFLEMYLA